MKFSLRRHKMIKKNLLPIILVILVIAVIFVIAINQFNSHTNIHELIEKSLSEQYEEDIKIKIFETYEVFNYKIIGFTIEENEKCSFAVLEQDGDLKYKLIRLDKYEKLLKRGLDIYVQYIDLYNDNLELDNYMIVLSMNAELSKIEKSLNDGKPTYYNIASSPSMTVLKFPLEASEVQYIFYDRLGNEIR